MGRSCRGNRVATAGDMRMVEVVHWNPRRQRFNGISFGRRVNNFGDMVGPFIVESLREELGLLSDSDGHQRLLAVGSIMHFARDGDVVWGSGVNGKISREQHTFRQLDVRAVRGPKTRAWLDEQGIFAPEVYGDPALLLPRFMPELVHADRSRKYVLIPNLNDAQLYRNHPEFVNPRAGLRAVITQICSSEFVIGSSLHALVIAEAFGVAAVLMKSHSEPDFKYLDYVQGTGRQDIYMAATLDAALKEGALAARRQHEALAAWSPDALLSAFPTDLWQLGGTP